jgi:DNA-binding transcriptional MerR regulator
VVAEAQEDLAGRRGGKSAGAFRTISEVASELDVPQHVLRFWESKFAQVKPLKRGGGRRYYRPEDVELLRRIRSLLYEDGYTIKGVQKLLRENGRKAFPDVARPESGVRKPAAPRPAGSGLAPSKAKEIEAAIGNLTELKELLRKSR